MQLCVSEHSREAISYKINHTINKNSQFMNSRSCKKEDLYMEIIKPQLGLGRFMSLRMTQIPLGRDNSNMFRCRISIDAWHSRLHTIPISCFIKIYAANDNNKRGITSNMIRKYITVGNTPREANRNSFKAILKISSKSFS